MKNNCIILFMKVPKPGFVKTRLAKDIGNEQACYIYKQLVEKTVQTIMQTGIDFEIHYIPKNDLKLLESCLGIDLTYFPQNEGDLGEKMNYSMEKVFQKGYQKVILIGSDIPGLTKNILINAFASICKNPVLGPTHDGGYYLIGSHKDHHHSSFFNEIQWSTSSVLDQTVSQMAKKGYSPYFMSVLNDIDTINDLFLLK